MSLDRNAVNRVMDRLAIERRSHPARSCAPPACHGSRSSGVKSSRGANDDADIWHAEAATGQSFEYLRQRLRKQVEEADVDGAEYTALLMATTMSQIAIMQGGQRGDPKVISSMRQKGAFL